MVVCYWRWLDVGNIDRQGYYLLSTALLANGFLRSNNLSHEEAHRMLCK